MATLVDRFADIVVKIAFWPLDYLHNRLCTSCKEKRNGNTA